MSGWCRLVGLLCSVPLWACAAPVAPEPMPTRWASEPPRVRAVLERAWAAEKGSSGFRDEALAVALYCEAARYGSAEGHYRSGLLKARGPDTVRDPVQAKFFLLHARELGHDQAGQTLASSGLADVRQDMPRCLTDDKAYEASANFAESSYRKQLPPARQGVAAMVAKLAPEYGIDPKLALAIAGVESNFDKQAVSPKNAVGVMQLIPATAERFNVRDRLDPEQNIRGGLSYLRWLTGHFGGDLVRVVAAYNAGEGAVRKHGGIPPYFETRAYVWRVLKNAGLKQ